MFKKYSLFLPACMLAVLMALPAAGQTLRGVGTIRLTAPVNAEITEQVKREARRNLRSRIVGWSEEVLSFEFDTANAIDRIHLDSLTESCIRRADAASNFDGPKWTYTYTLTQEQITAAVEEHNTRLDSASYRSFRIMKKAVEYNQMARIFVLGIRTLFMAKGHAGAPLLVPDNPNKLLIEETQITLAPLMNRLTITGPAMIITGKPGSKPPEDIYLEVKLDSFPVPALNMVACLPNGKRLFTSRSEMDGKLLFNKFTIPYVPNGTFLYIRPDLGRLIDSGYIFSPADLGIRSSSPEQTLMFKIVRPTVALSYKATVVNNLAMPKDYIDNPGFKKFLKDSCSMDPVPPGVLPDITLSVICQASSYAEDQTEETSMKFEAQIEIAEMTTEMKRSKKDYFSYVKNCEFTDVKNLPVGLFFWESNIKLQRALKAILGTW